MGYKGICNSPRLWISILREDESMELSNISLGKLFRILKKEIKKTLKENPNHLVKVAINLKFGGDTTVDVDIVTDESVLILNK